MKRAQQTIVFFVELYQKCLQDNVFDKNNKRTYVIFWKPKNKNKGYSLFLDKIKFQAKMFLVKIYKSNSLKVPKNEYRTKTGKLIFLNMPLISFCREWKINLQVDKFYRKLNDICEDCLEKKIEQKKCSLIQKQLPKHKREKVIKFDSSKKEVKRNE